MRRSLTANLRPYDRGNGQAGLIVPSNPAFGGFAANVLIANRKYGVRVCPSRDTLLTSIGMNVTTVEGSSGDSAMDLGIFDATGATKLASTGPATGVVNSTGWHHVSLTAAYRLLAGVTYYAALSTAATFSGTAPNVLAVTPVAFAGRPFGTTLGVLEHGVQTSAGGTLTAPFAPTSDSSVIPVFCLREI